MASSKGLQETELRSGLKDGGAIQGLLVVARGDGEAVEYVIYIRTTWTRGYRILRTWRDKDDRTFRSMDRLLKLPELFGYHLPITIYRQGCAELQKFRGVLASDGGAKGSALAEAVGSDDLDLLPPEPTRTGQ